MTKYKTKIEKILEKYHSDKERGLKVEQVAKNANEYGENVFVQDEREPLYKKIIHQIFEVMNIILLFAFFLSLYISLKEPSHGYAEPAVLIIILIVNIGISIYQEGKAEDTLHALKELSSPNSNVIRDGTLQTIPSESLVVGDLLVIETGEHIGADVRLLQTNQLQIDESSLTGESIVVDKHNDDIDEDNVPLAEQYNMAFAGTNVMNGNGMGIVVGVGKDSQMGQIADLLTTQVKEKTPLQKRIDKLAKFLAVIAFIAGVIIFILNYYMSDMPFFKNLMSAVTLGIAAVPETLPVIVTLSLALGVENVAKKNALIRKMPAIETLGNASIIASDKTGTLTQNKMEIQRLWTQESGVTNVLEDTLDKKEIEVLTYFGLASNATSVVQEDGTIQFFGEPTEVAIIRALYDLSIKKEDIDNQYERVLELPFDSSRKMMTTVHKLSDKYLVLTKGAFDNLNKSCENNTTTIAERQDIHDALANQAYRILALSYKFVDELPQEEDYESLEQGQCFLGMVGMIDPPRKESKAAVAAAYKAGIKPIMITGDHALTATAIAKELDIYRDGDIALTGKELQQMSDEELANNIERYSVYARVSPKDKIRIVKAWQKQGHVVAMTGDGVNDAPSLKAADVGTAMGISGTEVAKSASDMILLDDNFASIVNAIAEGRRVYLNIKKTVYYLLSANIAEIMIMIIGALLGWGAPVTGIQLLFINVLADGIPGFGLSREKADIDVMSQPPIKKGESLLSSGGHRRIIVAAGAFTIGSLLAYYIGAFVSIGGVAATSSIGQTMTFLVLGLSSTIHVYVARSNSPIFKSNIKENKTILYSGMISIMLTIAVVLIPALRDVFELVALTPTHWLIAIPLSFIIIFVIEIEKVVLKKIGKNFFE